MDLAKAHITRRGSRMLRMSDEHIEIAQTKMALNGVFNLEPINTFEQTTGAQCSARSWAVVEGGD